MLTRDDQLTFIGFDGGGTNTRAALLSARGELLGHGTSGASNFQSVGVEMARRNIAEARAMAIAGRGLNAPSTAGFLGMAGVVSERDRETILSIATELEIARTLDADHDIRIALAGGLAGAPGIALIAGTGSSCYGRNSAGESWRAGGWGHLLDDLGSGYRLGLEGMIAIARAADGRSIGTSLTSRLTNALGLEHIDDLSRRVGHDGLSRADIAALAPLVLEAAGDGDNAASDILERGADELAIMVHAVATRLGMDEMVRVALIGGLFSNRIYAEMVAVAIARRLPEAIAAPPMLPPVLGAALLAMELANIPVTPGVIDRMRAAIPLLAEQEKKDSSAS
ncbi:MAG: BadF/BadG/BcrA/BcrD ATPase family protein [Bacteroidota bacterium]